MYLSFKAPVVSTPVSSGWIKVLSNSVFTPILLSMIALLLFLLTLKLTLSFGNLYLNISDSLPAGLYASSKPDGPLRKNDLVLSCLPDDAALFASGRGYLAAHGLLNRCNPIGKYVVATAGDKVRVNTDGITVNDRLLPHTAPLQYDGQGRKLFSTPLETSLKQHELMLANFLPNSYDSRYFGIIQDDHILGRLKPVFTF